VLKYTYLKTLKGGEAMKKKELKLLKELAELEETLKAVGWIAQWLDRETEESLLITLDNIYKHLNRLKELVKP
jgi:hypothetical protein